MRPWRYALMLTSSLLWMGCPSSTNPTDGGNTPQDSGHPTQDAGLQDAGVLDAGMTDGGSLAIAIPGTAPYDTWTWIPVAGTQCGDGSATGIAVNPHAGSENLMIYFEGGGACWNYDMCAGLGPAGASHLDGFGAANIATDLLAFYEVFDRTDTANPFAGDNIVFVPYCTGDIHAGNNVNSYAAPDGGALVIHHVGYANVGYDLGPILATFPTPARVVITGSSAGGYGSAFNYGRLHAAYPGVPAYLIDDSGPPLRGSEAWYAQQDSVWKESANFPVGCDLCLATLPDGGANPDGGIYQLLPHYVQDATFRGSLLETWRDEVISGFYEIPPGTQVNIGCTDGGTCQFESQLNDLYTNVIQPANAAGPGQLHVYLAAEHFHTFLPEDFNYGTGGSQTSLKTFLTQQLSDAGTWSDVVAPMP